MNSVYLLEELKKCCQNYEEEKNGITITNSRSILRVYLPDNPAVSDYVLFDLIEGTARTSAYTSDITELIDLCIEVFGAEAIRYNKEQTFYKL